MADTSKIEWTDSTFNPWIGCTKVSPACDHCYAEVSTPARALAVAWGPKAERRRTSPQNWALPLRWEREHESFEAEHGRRRRVFCASLADVFDNQVSPSWRADLFQPNLDWRLAPGILGLGDMRPRQSTATGVLRRADMTPRGTPQAPRAPMGGSWFTERVRRQRDDFSMVCSTTVTPEYPPNGTWMPGSNAP